VVRQFARSASSASSVGHAAAIQRTPVVTRLSAVSIAITTTLGRAGTVVFELASSIAHAATNTRSATTTRTLFGAIAHNAALNRALELVRQLGTSISNASGVEGRGNMLYAFNEWAGAITATLSVRFGRGVDVFGQAVRAVRSVGSAFTRVKSLNPIYTKWKPGRNATKASPGPGSQ
jgi:hypothetical protein